MYSEWEEEMFYPGKNNKWAKFRTKMWDEMRDNGFWWKGNLWYDAHYEHELRNISSGILLWYREQYKPNKQNAELIPI